MIMNTNKSVKKIKRSAFALSYAQILQPGVYTVKASNSHKIYDEKLGKYKYIVNFKAVAKHKVGEVMDLFQNAEEVELSELNGLTMSGNIIMDDELSVLNVPMNNELVKVTADYVASRDGEEILAIIALKVAEPIKPQGFNFDKPKPVSITEEAREGQEKPAMTKAEKRKAALPVTAADDVSASF